MTVHEFFQAAQWFFLVYLSLLTLGYLALNALSMVELSRQLQHIDWGDLPPVLNELMPPVSILVPAHNEATTIVSSVSSLLQLVYPEFEVIVVNDGSRDRTLAELKKAFALQPYPEPPRDDLMTARVRGCYQSATQPQLRVIDKDNGGKADSLNAGINLARYPLFCAIDADSVLQRDSLIRVVQPFLHDPRTVAAGGTVRIANGCTIRQGFLEKVALPRNPWALFQVVEYLRAFLFGRLGWSPINGLLVISGAFGMFRRAAVIEAGGYGHDTVGEDMELVVRLHRTQRRHGRPYRISFLPDPICWTEAPEDLGTLGRQRARWQRGLGESLAHNLDLMLSRNGGVPGWLAYPFALVFELFSPLIELLGYVLMAIGFAIGAISVDAFVAFLALAIGLGILLSILALLLEEMSFHLYSEFRQLALLLVFAVLENFGYRQLMLVMRLQGLFQWLAGRRGQWGRMRRSGAWQE